MKSWCAFLVVACALPSPSAMAQGGGVQFVELVDPGIDGYARVGSTSVAEVEAIHQGALAAPITMFDMIPAPMMPRGLPGVAILDFDGDGDLDLYATNGPGGANALLSNQLMETGAVTFVDVAVAAGVDATDQDSFGTCFGDTDNDGDHDLLVLGRNEPNRFFENDGDGTFSHDALSGIGGGNLSSTGCSMADFNGDGLLDVVVANTFDQDDSFPIFAELYALNQHNQLFLNQGDGTFVDASAGSGITDNGSFYLGRAGITWGVGSADVDLDGDVDIVFMDDQGAVPPSRVCHLYPPDFPLPCTDRALIHVFLNDGHGEFVDHPMLDGDHSASEWMGVSFGDLDCDGNMDMFASSFGGYGNAALGLAYVGGSDSRPMMGNGDGSFRDVGVGAVNATPFGWGSAIFDYDNDGDSDVLVHGGLDAANLGAIRDNPGTLLQNQGCSGEFVADETAISADHITRNVRGVAVGDFDRNGFVDVATVANFTLNPSTPLIPIGAVHGSVYDDTAFFAPLMAPVTPPGVVPALFTWTGVENGLGNLMVELNGGNSNASATIALLGTVGITSGGAVNRDGIGAVLSFTPRSGQTTLSPMVGGSSHASQHALERVFGMGAARRGTLDVLWPGGTRNRLYGVRSGEQISMPEIPCSYDGQQSLPGYLRCVVRSIHELRRADVIEAREVSRIVASAVVAYLEG